MNELILKQLYDSLINTFINKNVNHQHLVRLGFVVNDCNTSKVNMLIHCLDNISIFNDKQKRNISFLINKYNNV